MRVTRRRFFGAVGLGSFLIAVGAIRAQGEYLPKGKRDPFVPLLTPEGQRIHPPGEEEPVAGRAAVTLQGIVFDPQAESYAVINGRIVREQEEIDGMKILKIEPDGVTVLVDGTPRTIPLRPSTEGKETP